MADYFAAPLRLTSAETLMLLAAGMALVSSGTAPEALRTATEKLQEALLPDYPVGGKRILVSDDYYQTLGRENVEVVTAGIDRVKPHAVVTGDGTHHPVDAIILATGFETTSFLAPMVIDIDPEVEPVAAKAEIVRKADPEREGIEGIGARFLSFAGDSQIRLETILGNALCIPLDEVRTAS